MGWIETRTGRDGSPRYIAKYRDLYGRKHSAGTFASKREANGAWQRAEVQVAEGQREVAGLGELVGDPVPHRGGSVVLPEDRGLGLLRGAYGAGGGAQCLHLGQVLGVAGAGQRRRA